MDDLNGLAASLLDAGEDLAVVAEQIQAIFDMAAPPVRDTMRRHSPQWNSSTRMQAIMNPGAAIRPYRMTNLPPLRPAQGVSPRPAPTQASMRPLRRPVSWTIPSRAVPAPENVSPESSNAGPEPSNTRYETSDAGSVGLEPPDHLLCPILLGMLVDPVISTVSGLTYSRAAIERHLDRHSLTDPITKQRMTKRNLQTNYLARAAIEHFRAANTPP